MDSTTTRGRESSEIMNVFYRPGDPDYNWRNESLFLLDLVKRLLRWINDGSRRNSYVLKDSLKNTGFFAGYTPLHIACMHFKNNLVYELINDHHVDVNAMADDGTQPIHHACLVGCSGAFKILLENGANVNAELSKTFVLKYDDERWNDDFGDKMTMLAFATVHNYQDLLQSMITYKPNTEIKSITNKTLLMLAIECDLSTGILILEHFSKRELINARDNNGYSPIHYLFHPKRYRGYQYSTNYFNPDKCIENLTHNLIRNGANIHATVGDDLLTLPLNMAAYRCCSIVLKILLPRYECITKSRALYYATLTLGESQSSLNLDPSKIGYYKWEKDEEHQILSVELIVKDLMFRLTFGLFVPKEEQQLLDELIAMDPKIGEIVHSYKRDFIEGRLKSAEIRYGNESITYYDFAMKCCDRRKLRSVVTNQALMEVFENKKSLSDWDEYNTDCYHYDKFLDVKIQNVRKRMELLKKLKKIDQLRKAVPLPYELILEIVDYLNNHDLEKFINAFFN